MSNMKWIGVLVAMGVELWLVEPVSAQEAPVPEGTPVPAAIAEAAAAPVAAAAVADAPTSAESLEALRAPEGPAFAILGLAPSEIQRPTTSKEVAVSLSQFLEEDGDVRIPDSFAMQVAPYWVWPRDALTYEQFAASGAGQLLQNLTLSLAAANAGASSLHDLGAGVGTHLGWGGRSVKRCNDDDGARKSLLRAAEQSEVAMEGIAGLAPADLQKLKDAARAKKKEELQNQFGAARQACAESLTAHPHSLALAAAWAWQFPDMTGGDGDLVTQAYWATYAWSSGRWSALGLARLRFEEAVVGWDGFVDGGGRVRYGGKGAAISIEALGRLQVRGEDKQDARSRLALVAELELKADNWLSLTLGKTFESEGPVALVSLTSSFGTPEVAPLSTK